MGAEKRLQKVLDKANKNTGNTTEATDNREEISDALVSSGKGRLVRKGKKLYDKMIIKKNKNNN
jgi:nucleoid-associated protein YgaU